MSSTNWFEREIRQRLAHNVRRLRNEAGLTVEEAAELADLHWRHWQKVEAGHTNATLQTIVRLAKALEIDPGELIAAPGVRSARGRRGGAGRTRASSAGRAMVRKSRP